MSFLRGIIIAIGLLLLWQLLVQWTQIPDYILPSPLVVKDSLLQHAAVIADNAKFTVIETLLGFLIGCLFGMLLAINLAMFHKMQPWILPILVASQAIPTFAIAPLLVIWLGYGMVSKIATAALVIFFPVTTAFYDGLRKTPRIWLELATTMQASRWQILWQIKLPAALPQLASGLRIAAAFAPIGAIIGEWVGSSQGLGYLMLNANARLQVPFMFAVLFVVVVFTLLLYFIVDRLCQYFVWSE